jgi:hypothetical protein
MISRNLSRRLEKLEECVLPPENRVVLRIVFVNTDGSVAPGGFTVDPWGALADGTDRGASTPKSPQSRGR